jgi:TonB family protein
MSVIPQKIRSGLVELRTHKGPLYVSPSVWQRVYLLWTFRNFHRLPQQVLNRRQRQLIERLGRTAVVLRRGPLALRPIIGSVENVEIAGAEKESSARSNTLISMSPRVAVRRAVGFDSIPVGRNRSTASTVASFPTPPTTNRPKPKLLQSVKSAFSRFTLRGVRAHALRRRLRGALVAIGCIALATVALYWHETREVSSTSFPLPVIPSSDMQPRSGTSTPLAQPAVNPIPKPAVHTTPATSVAVQTNTAAAPVEPPHNPRKVNSLTTRPAESTSSEHLSVAESPQIFTYPIAPDAALKGRVILRAVVGTEGNITNIDVLSGNPSLAKAALRAVRRWQYASYQVDGKPVEVETGIVINFLGDEVVSVSFARPR